ncbi:MAG: TonB-dependent receptor plug domain-containing protein, partial [Thiotrichales bacterium]|nr:TonB-dependent receptor plug domain-containing protein [Thiotrichales bacterium]
MQPKSFIKKTLVSSLLMALGLPAVQAQTELNAVTVTSSTIEDRFESDADIPASTTFISGEVVEEKHAQNLIEVLRSIPGITADLAGEGDGIKIKIRGVDNQRYMGEK